LPDWAVWASGSIRIGKAGNQIGNWFWRQLCLEHQIEVDKHDQRGCQQGEQQGYLDVFFNEGRSKRALD
jgi:hypothetical protein